MGGEGVGEKGKGLEERKEGKLVGWKINFKKCYFEKLTDKIFFKNESGDTECFDPQPPKRFFCFFPHLKIHNGANSTVEFQ